MRPRAITLILLLTLALSLLAVPLLAEAQQANVKRVGRMVTGPPCDSPVFQRHHAALVRGLREYGWVEGQNVVVACRSAEGNLDRLAAIAAEFVRLTVDVMALGLTIPPSVLFQADRVIR